MLLSDIGMPGEDGYDAHPARARAPAGPGRRRPGGRAHGLRARGGSAADAGAGYTMHVTKPLDPAELIMVVSTLARYQTRATAAASGAARRG